MELMLVSVSREATMTRKLMQPLGRGVSSCRTVARLRQAVLPDLSLDFYVAVRPRCS